MKRQRGQAVVEFALVLPFFLMLLFGILLSGLLFADYMTLSNVARSSAREAALGGNTAEISQAYKDNTQLMTNLYLWNDSIDFSDGDLPNSIEATITTNLNTNFPGVSVLDFFGMPLPATYTIKYTMHNEQTNNE